MILSKMDNWCFVPNKYCMPVITEFRGKEYLTFGVLQESFLSVVVLFARMLFVVCKLHHVCHSLRWFTVSFTFWASRNATVETSMDNKLYQTAKILCSIDWYLKHFFKTNALICVDRNKSFGCGRHRSQRKTIRSNLVLSVCKSVLYITLI